MIFFLNSNYPSLLSPATALASPRRLNSASPAQPPARPSAPAGPASAKAPLAQPLVAPPAYSQATGKSGHATPLPNTAHKTGQTPSQGSPKPATVAFARPTAAGGAAVAVAAESNEPGEPKNQAKANASTSKPGIIKHSA